MLVMLDEKEFSWLIGTNADLHAAQNEFGRPCLTGCFRTLLINAGDEEGDSSPAADWRGYHKPIMIVTIYYPLPNAYSRKRRCTDGFLACRLVVSVRSDRTTPSRTPAMSMVARTLSYWEDRPC